MVASRDGDSTPAAPSEQHRSSVQPEQKRGWILSRRRWRWLFRVALLLAGCYLLKPTRSLLDQWIAQQFDPHVSLQCIRWHTRPLVAELRHVDWQPIAAKHGLTASVERAWFAIDGEALLDARFVSPRAMLEDARFSIDARGHRSESIMHCWQAGMSSKFAGLDWQNIPLRFAQQVSSEGEGESWQTRAATWLNRSMTLASRASERQRTALSIDNPLRIESEQSRVLTELSKLAEEHTSLQQQFELLVQLLQSKVNRVDEELTRQLATLSKDVDAQRKDEAFIESLAQRMVQTTAGQAWMDLESCVMFGDALCQSQWGPVDALGINQRQDNSWIECMDISAEAKLLRSMSLQMLKLDGSYRRDIRREFDRPPRSTWQIELQTLPSTRIVASNRDQQRQITDIQATAIATVAASDSSVASITSTNRLVLACEGDEISGQITLLPRDWQPLLPVAVGDELTLEVKGRWSEPSFELVEPLPDWLLAAVKQLFNDELDHQRQELDERLRGVATQRKVDLQRLLADVQQGASAGKRHYEEIVSCEKSLRDYFADMDKEYEFARRTNSLKR